MMSAIRFRLVTRRGTTHLNELSIGSGKNISRVGKIDMGKSL